MASRAIQIGDADVIKAGLAEFERIEADQFLSSYEKACSRDGVRGMMVRLNLYSAFCVAVNDAELEKERD